MTEAFSAEEIEVMELNGITRGCALNRIKRLGWSREQAISKPPIKKRFARLFNSGKSYRNFRGGTKMKIKVNKEFTLLGLIEYIKKNGIANKVFLNKKGKGKVVVGDDRHLYMTDLNLTDTFTVEAEEVITERAVIPLLVETYLSSKGEPSCYSYRNKSINYILENNKYYNNMPPKHIYKLNDDMTMTLIWKDGELVK